MSWYSTAGEVCTRAGARLRAELRLFEESRRCEEGCAEAGGRRDVAVGWTGRVERWGRGMRWGRRMARGRDEEV